MCWWLDTFLKMLWNVCINVIFVPSVFVCDVFIFLLVIFQQQLSDSWDCILPCGTQCWSMYHLLRARRILTPRWMIWVNVLLLLRRPYLYWLVNDTATQFLNALECRVNFMFVSCVPCFCLVFTACLGIFHKQYSNPETPYSHMEWKCSSHAFL